MKIFISWSKDASKQAAIELKKFISEFFRSKSLDIFLSISEIQPGEAWFDKVREAIEGSSVCIIVLTDENELSRWLYFEAGAIAFNTESSKNIVPLLLNSREIDKSSPLSHYQCVRNTPEDLLRLFRTIKKEGKLTGVREEDFQTRFQTQYSPFNLKINGIIEQTFVGALANVPFGHIFPKDTKRTEVGTVFIGAPMASHQSAIAYENERKRMAEFKEAVDICCPSVKRIYWAGSEIPSVKKFDGEQIALTRDLGQLKLSEICLFVLFAKLPTSVHVEIGYAIALNKKIVIFCKNREDLPFLLKRADKQISNLSIYECSSYDELLKLIDKDGEAIISNETRP
ncbi:MAG TPA: toll/interleukin-1 receptor domain-containing protein [Pirellulales bacterium]|jgi:hypothetical protein